MDWGYMSVLVHIQGTKESGEPIPSGCFQNRLPWGVLREVPA